MIKQARHLSKGCFCLIIGLLCLLPLYALAEVDIDSTFSDENFRAYVKSELDKDKDDKLSDAEIEAVTEMNVNNKQIKTLSGIGVFTFLEMLDCGNNNDLTALPVLPGTLTELYASNIRLATLPILPSGLEVLDYSKNYATSLPTLPSGLKVLDCSWNYSTSLPTLPSGLETLNCEWNRLTALPQLPHTLTVLICRNNQLTALPTLPAGLEELDCYGNQLTKLPALPSGLVSLNCGINQLTALPSPLPDALITLNCFTNQLTALPSLPSGLQTLSTFGNQLTELPTLPSGLVELTCYRNQLTALPSLPNSLEKLDCDSNRLTALPSLPNALVSLTCIANKLTASPKLPDSLEILQCYSNQLTTLPSLPETLRQLQCNSNQLTTLPSLPETLINLQCNSNLLTTLPTLPSGIRQINCTNNQLIAADLLPISRLVIFRGTDQTRTLWLAGNDTDGYTLAIELNEPDFKPTTGLSYANGVLKSDSKELKSSPFTVETGHARFRVDGTLTLKYGEMIAVSFGEGGSITPSGQVGVEYGKNQTFAIKADTGYRIKDVLVNGTSIGKEASYTFTNVQVPGSIEALFEKIPYTVTASRTLGGSITPLGKTTVLYGGSQAYTIAPDEGYRIQDVKVNGKSIGVVTSYTFEKVKADATIEVSFEKADYTITASAGKGGTISPTGAVGVLHGESQVFTLTAEDGYRVKDVKVNGRSLGVMNSYTFSNVQADATIEAQFEERPIDPVPPTGDRFPLEMLVISLFGMVLLAVVLLRKAKKA